MLTRFIIRIIGSALALYVASLLVAGFMVQGGWREYALAGVVLALLNAILKPILKLISMPLIILTLGLFSLVINGVILWIVDYTFDFIIISDFAALFWSTLLITVVNLFVSVGAKAAR